MKLCFKIDDECVVCQRYYKKFKEILKHPNDTITITLKRRRNDITWHIIYVE